MNTRPVMLSVVAGLWWPIAAWSQVVPVGYQHVALEYGVPPSLLYAVALTESGQSLFSRGEFRPWPWALNIDGEGYYYPSRQQAWEALQVVLTEPRASVDVGLMQINWRYHQASLGSAWQALEPYHNLEVAAAILRDCFAQLGDWLPSAGCYHAPNHAERARRYSQRVNAHWRRLDVTDPEVRR